MRTGWVCPKCQKVYSPTVQECWSCNQSVQRPTFKFEPEIRPDTTVAPSPHWPNTIIGGSVSVPCDPNILSWN